MAAACKDAVRKYMLDENRPYSANDVHQNTHGKYTKPAVQKALDELALQGLLLCKEQGKSKIYCAAQPAAGGRDDISAELLELDSSILSVSQNLKSVEQQLREAEATSKALESALTTEAAEAEVAAMESRLEHLRAKLADLTDNCIKISPEDRNKIQRQHEACLRLYRQRKRLCNEILNDFLESCDKSKKELIEEMGIETDEDAGVNL